MIARCLQLLSLLILCVVAPFAQAAELEPGSVHRLVFHDVDGNDLSTADDHITIITVVTRQNEEKARAVAHQVPDKYKGDPKYRYVTLVNFQRKLFGALQGITRGVIRRRLDGEARELKSDYETKKITRDPRRDLYVVPDFDGAAVAQLGLSPDSDAVFVFVFDGKGKLIERWEDVPPAGALAKAIAAAD